MIVYETNKYWLKDISQWATSYTMKRVMRAVVWIGIYTTLLALVNYYFGYFEKLSLFSGLFSLLGIALSILLVFRTNTAYDRWWEGRKLWGSLVNNSRNLAIMAHSTFPTEQKMERHRLAVLISNFCVALRDHLRKGALLTELEHLTPQDLEKYGEKKHLPSYIASQIHFLVNHQHREKHIVGEDIINFKPHLQSLMDICGACERIKKTPIPFSYNVYLKIFITAYGLMMPVSIVPEIGFWAIPLVMFIFFAFIGIQLLAEEIEDPFGLDCNDLPTGNIAETIKNNVFEILESRTFTEEEKHLYQKVF
jgi:ion channel-forming bestrophin family protein